MSAQVTRRLLLALALAATLPAAASAQERQQVRFKAGSDHATIEGKVKGEAYLDYVLGARKGQTMTVSIDGVPYFNVMPPGSIGEAIYNGAIETDSANLTLPENGDYTIRVYLMGADADEDRERAFKLTVGIR